MCEATDTRLLLSSWGLSMMNLSNSDDRKRLDDAGIDSAQAEFIQEVAIQGRDPTEALNILWPNRQAVAYPLACRLAQNWIPLILALDTEPSLFRI